MKASLAAAVAVAKMAIHSVLTKSAISTIAIIDEYWGSQLFTGPLLS